MKKLIPKHQAGAIVRKAAPIVSKELAPTAQKVIKYILARASKTPKSNNPKAVVQATDAVVSKTAPYQSFRYVKSIEQPQTETFGIVGPVSLDNDMVLLPYTENLYKTLRTTQLDNVPEWIDIPQTEIGDVIPLTPIQPYPSLQIRNGYKIPRYIYTNHPERINDPNVEIDLIR